MNKSNEEIRNEFVGDNLPYDCIFIILEYLGEIDFIRISSSSKNWSISVASRSNRIWKDTYQRFLNHGCRIQSSLWKKKVKKKKSFFEKYTLIRNLEKSYFENLYPGAKYYPFNYCSLRIKLVVVGDGGCGKTSMLISFTNNTYPDDYIPYIFEPCNPTVLFENLHISLSVWDTHEGEDYDTPRKSSYQGADVVLICFSLMEPKSLENVRKKWVDEVRKYCPKVPFILCGNKLDLREDICMRRYPLDVKPVTTREGENVSKEIGGVGYVENSAKTQKGLKDVFQFAISSALKNSGKKRTSNDSKCKIM